MIPVQNEIYRHFKGKLYQIVCMAQHSETGEKMVVYRALYGTNDIYVRPLDMFTEKLDTTKYPQAGQIYRFEKVTEPDSCLETMQNGRIEGCNQSEEIDKQPEERCNQSEEKDKQPEEKCSQSEDLKEAQCGITDTEDRLSDTAMLNSTGMEEEADQVDPLILEFLDADTLVQKNNILTALHHRITDAMIDTLAAAMDIVVEEGDIEERYYQLKNCLGMKEKFEIKRP